MSINRNTESLSETELCAQWSVCPRTLFNWRKKGNMPPHFKSGQQIRYLVSDIEDFISQRTYPKESAA